VAWRDGRALPSWFGPFLVGLGSTVLILYRPGITPDHPWADRRLVPVVLPTVVLLACAALVWLAARLPPVLSGPVPRSASRSWPTRLKARLPTGLSNEEPAGLSDPPAARPPKAASDGGPAGAKGRLPTGLKAGLPAGLRSRLPAWPSAGRPEQTSAEGVAPVARAVVPVIGGVLLLGPVLAATAPVATERTERGEVAALRRACAAFGPSDTAVLLGSRAANEWPQVLRGVCGVPSLVVRWSPTRPVPQATLDRVVEGIAAAGRRPVLVTADAAQVLTAVGARPRQVVDLRTTEDARLLTRRPASGVPLDVDLWVAPVRSSAR
jgi:hypothetical protein